MAASGKKKSRPRRSAAPVLTARVNARVTLEASADGTVVARFEDGYRQGFGKFSAAALKRLPELKAGFPLASIAKASAANQDVSALLRRLARSGLLEYRFGPGGGDSLIVIEPQVAAYWPEMAKIGDSETVVLSRFAYLRRRGGELVMESARAGALFRISDPKFAAVLATLSQPQKISQLRREPGFAGLELLALLVDCQILIKLKTGDHEGSRPSEGDANLVLWDFHDLLFHTRSNEGRQANPIGGLYSYARLMPPPPAVRPRWPGPTINLETELASPSPFAQLLHQRQSARDFDDNNPITLAELAKLLLIAARVRGHWTSEAEVEEGLPEVSFATRPYPSAGAAYELELYLTVNNCTGLARGFYHYDAERHALTSIDAKPQQLDQQLSAAEFAMDAPNVPQILITIAARFDRVSWKYSSVAYALVLKNVGVLLQTLYLAATDNGLGGCAIGTNNIDLFSAMTGLEFHVEGPVGQFALGRVYKAGPADSHPG